jgi:hypothetical protein
MFRAGVAFGDRIPSTGDRSMNLILAAHRKNIRA